MKLAVISSRFPRGRSEPYLGVELESLRPHLQEVIVEPLRPTISWETLRLFSLALLRTPRRSLGALVTVLRGDCRFGVKLKNLAIYPRALALAEKFHRAKVGHVHSYWLSTPATAAMIVARVNGIPWSSTAHRWDISEKNMTAQKASSAAFVRAISEHGRKELVSMVPGLAGKFTVVRLGTALRGEAPASRVGADAGPHLLCAAAFVPKKGHRDLLDAFAGAHALEPSLRLTLCGAGILEKRVRRYAQTLACRDAIAFRGYVAHQELLAELRRADYDAVILASREDGTGMEGVPSILIEAASLSIACIATRSGAVEELLDDESAFLAPPRRPDLLASAILAACNRTERRRRAERAAVRARGLHDPARSASQLCALLGVPA